MGAALGLSIAALNVYTPEPPGQLQASKPPWPVTVLAGAGSAVLLHGLRLNRFC